MRASSQCPDVYPAHVAPGVADAINHVLGAAWPVTALTVPYTDERDIGATNAPRLVEHPQIHAFKGIGTFGQRPEYLRGREEPRPCDDRTIALGPAVVREFHGLVEEYRLIKR